MMAVVAIDMAVFGTSAWITSGLLAVWGTLGAAAPIAWSTWLTRTLPNDAEAGGGLMVAVIQLGITIGATVGGVVFDSLGGSITFLSSAGILALSGLVAFAARQVHTRQRVTDCAPRKSPSGDYQTSRAEEGSFAFHSKNEPSQAGSREMTHA